MIGAQQPSQPSSGAPSAPTPQEGAASSTATCASCGDVAARKRPIRSLDRWGVSTANFGVLTTVSWPDGASPEPSAAVLQELRSKSLTMASVLCGRCISDWRVMAGQTRVDRRKSDEALGILLQRRRKIAARGDAARRGSTPRSCFACEVGIVKESALVRFHHPLCLGDARQQQSTWPLVSAEIRRRCGLTNEQINELCDRRKILFVCNPHACDMQKAVDAPKAASCFLCGVFVPADTLRRMRIPSPDDEEAFEDVEQQLHAHFGCEMRAVDIVRKPACSSCRWLIEPVHAPGDEERARESLRLRFSSHPAVMKAVIARVCATLGAALPLYLSESGDEKPGGEERFVNSEAVVKSCLLAREIVSIYVDIATRHPGAPTTMDRRTLMKYITPHLAIVGVQLAVGSSRLGHIFYAPPGVVATSRAAELRGAMSALADCGANSLTIDDESAALKVMSTRYGSLRTSYRAGIWSWLDEVRAVPEALWARAVLRVASERKKRRWRKLHAETGDVPFPVRNSAIPLNQADMDPCITRLSIRVLYQIEIQANTLDLGRSPGPMMVSLGLLSLTETTRAHQTLLNQIGVCLSYKAATSLRTDFALEETTGHGSERGNFRHVPDCCLCIAAIDNLNARNNHGMRGAGEKSGCGFDGLALQAIGFGGDPFVTCDSRRLSDVSRLNDVVKSRAEFVSALVPDVDDAELRRLNIVILGLINEHGARLDGRAASSPISLRHLLLSALRTLSATTVDIVYVKITENDKPEGLCIMDMIQYVKDNYRPGESGRPRHVVVEGDQFTFQYIHDAWLRSCRRRDSGGLWTWLIPLPGGFHIDKTGLQGVVRAAMSGFGLEQLVAVSGLSQGHVAGWAKQSNWRRVRRVLHQSTSALSLELIDSLIEADPTCGTALSREDQENGAQTFAEIAAEKSEADSFFKESTTLWEREFVTDSVVRKGRALVEATERLTDTAVSARVFVREKLQRVLYPYLMFNVLARSGQTHVLDKVMFALAPALHLTAKLKYCKLFIQYGATRLIMPRAVCNELYNKLPGKLVLSMQADKSRARQSKKRKNDGVHVFHDEAQEMGINRDAKKFCTRPDLMSSMDMWPSFAYQSRQVGQSMRQATQANSRAVSRGDATADMDDLRGPVSLSKRNLQSDREKRSTPAVANMRKRLRDSGHFSADHLKSSTVENLMTPAAKRPKLSDAQILSMETSDARGRTVLGLHAAHLYGREFNGALTPAEIKAEFDGKYVSKKWTYAFQQFPSTVLAAGITAGASKTKVGRRARVTAEAQRNARLKETDAATASIAKDLAIVGALTGEGPREALMCLSARLKDVRFSSRLVSAFAQAYRKEYDVDEPRHSAKHEYWRTLSKWVPLDRADLAFLCDTRSPTVKVPPASVIHADIMNSVHIAPQPTRSGTWRDAIMAKLTTQLHSFIGDIESSSLLTVVHLHIDVPEWTPLQKNAEKGRRDAARADPEDDEADLVMPCTLDQSYNINQSEWARIALFDREEKDAMASAHLALGAVACLTLNDMYNVRKSEIAARAGKSHYARTIQVFLHGGNIGISARAVGQPLSKVVVQKQQSLIFVDESSSKESLQTASTMPGSNLLTLKAIEGPIAAATPSATEASLFAYLSEPITPYGRGCCISVTKKFGFERHAAGDYGHGEAETGMIRAHLQQTEVASKEGPSGCVVQERLPSLFITRDNDCPNIMLCNHQTDGGEVTFLIGNNLIDIRAVRRAIDFLHLTPQCITLLFALGGCDFTAGTRGVSQPTFLRAVLNWNSNCTFAHRICLSQLSTAEDCDNVVVLAYLFTKGAKFTPEHEPLTAGWRLEARMHVAAISKRADDVIPEFEDVFLQWKRCLWVLKYWSTAASLSCTEADVGGCSVEWGYDFLGRMILELPSSVLARKKEIKTSAKVHCCCKGKCSGSCGCHKAGTMCLSSCGCKGYCAKGVLTMAGVANLTPQGPLTTNELDPSQADFAHLSVPNNAVRSEVCDRVSDFDLHAQLHSDEDNDNDDSPVVDSDDGDSSSEEEL